MIMGSGLFFFPWLCCLIWVAVCWPGGGSSCLSSPPLPPMYLPSRHKGLAQSCMETPPEHFSGLQVTIKCSSFFIILFFSSRTLADASQKVLQKNQKRVRNTKYILHLYCKNIAGSTCNTFNAFAGCPRPGQFLPSFPPPATLVTEEKQFCYKGLLILL